jgi:Ca2+-transporting ATPase
MKNEHLIYRQEAAQVFQDFRTTQRGLSTANATERLSHYRPNRLEVARKQSWLIRYLKQFKDFMILLLLVSSIISFFLGDRRTTIVLLVLVAFNTLIGFAQEFKAERIMESLVRLVVPEAKVKRNGEVNLISSSDIVPGDIIYIEEGDSVPADIRLFEESELSTNDFALTGESNPSRKFTHAISAETTLGLRNNLCFMGTTVATGHGYGVVIATGMQTELGRIANLSQETVQDDSPLQKEVNHIATRITQGTVVLCAILLPIAIQADLSIKDAFLFAIGIASSLIPQGLPAEINTSLAQAANRLAKARALVKKLSAVETLGATSIICTDKTGTLTKNQMTVEQLIIGQKIYTVTGSGYEANGVILHNNQELTEKTLHDEQLFFISAAAASNARVNPPDNDHNSWYAIGDPTEAALITLARKAKVEPNDLNKHHPELKEFAFDSGRKRMSSIRKWGDKNEYHVFCKGAPESIIEKSTHVRVNGKNHILTPDMKRTLLSECEELATKAMRNLAIAYRVLPSTTHIETLKMEEVEESLILLGVASMIDPLRDEVPQAMQAAHQANIAVSVITGDNAITAQAIALKAGLAADKDNINLVQGTEVQHLSDQDIIDLTSRGSVIFSRVSPEDKLRIVGLIKDSGRVVAVTGDGINDAPALKRADIGVAMGKTGTDVAKQSSEIVLLDDSFHTLVGAVQQGRIVFQNIKKGALSCFTSNSAELVVNLTSLAAASLFGVPLALTVMQILAIDLIAELFPIAALGWDKEDRDLMSDKPRNPKKHILDRYNVADLLWCGVLIGGFAFVNYMLFFSRANVSASTVLSGSDLHMKATALTYLTIVLCQLGNIFQRRSQDGLFTTYQLHNKQFWLAVAVSLFCVANIIYNPFIAPYFGAGPLTVVDWGYALGAAALFLVIREVQRVAVISAR